MSLSDDVREWSWWSSPELCERFIAKVDEVLSCWEWTAAKTKDGYGKFSVSRGRWESAHRVAFQARNGVIPDGLQIDHLCCNPCCVNPDHLEAVSPRINVLRSSSFAAKFARQTHCKRGHKFTPENTQVYKNMRFCRECRRQAARRYRQTK